MIIRLQCTLCLYASSEHTNPMSSNGLSQRMGLFFVRNVPCASGSVQLFCLSSLTSMAKQKKKNFHQKLSSSNISCFCLKWSFPQGSLVFVNLRFPEPCGGKVVFLSSASSGVYLPSAYFFQMICVYFHCW